MINRGTWVVLRRVVLTAQERAPGIPQDTAATPLMQWVKGALLSDAEIGGVAAVRTRTGRVEQGILEQSQPRYELGYGDFIPSLLHIGEQAGEILSGGDRHG